RLLGVVDDGEHVGAGVAAQLRPALPELLGDGQRDEVRLRRRTGLSPALLQLSLGDPRQLLKLLLEVLQVGELEEVEYLDASAGRIPVPLAVLGDLVGAVDLHGNEVASTHCGTSWLLVGLGRGDG